MRRSRASVTVARAERQPLPAPPQPHAIVNSAAPTQVCGLENMWNVGAAEATCCFVRLQFPVVEHRTHSNIFNCKQRHSTATKMLRGISWLHAENNADQSDLIRSCHTLAEQACFLFRIPILDSFLAQIQLRCSLFCRDRIASYVITCHTSDLRHLLHAASRRQAIVARLSKRLLGLLGGSAGLVADVLADVGRISSLANDVLEGSPALTSSRGSALVGELGINAGSDLVDSVLDEAALSVAGAEEDSVDSEQNPRALLEDESRSNNTEPKGDLEESDQSHASIVVLLDELANGLGESRGLGLSARC